MKKRLTAVLLVMAMVLGIAACSKGGGDAQSTDGSKEDTAGSGTDTQSDSGDVYRVGMAVYNLSNPVWSELVEEAQRYGKEKNLEVTYADAGQDSTKQISQIENFIQSGMDAIIILAIDVEAVEPLAKKAMDEGIYVIDYCRGLKNAHTSLELDPVKTGRALAEMAKEWLDENMKLSGEFKWGLLDIQTVELGVQEGAACEEAMEELMPNGKLVANASTLTVDEGMKNTESILQANPDLRVMLGLSAGSGVGGNEAMKAAAGSEDAYKDYALFSIDATEQEVLAIMNNEVLKGSISLGSGKVHAQMVIDYADSLLNGREVERKNYMPIEAITSENVQEFYDNTYKK
jgi:ribose transport system substrate-binding protein